MRGARAGQSRLSFSLSSFARSWPMPVGEVQSEGHRTTSPTVSEVGPMSLRSCRLEPARRFGRRSRGVRIALAPTFQGLRRPADHPSRLSDRDCTVVGPRGCAFAMCRHCLRTLQHMMFTLPPPRSAALDTRAWPHGCALGAPRRFPDSDAHRPCGSAGSSRSYRPTCERRRT